MEMEMRMNDGQKDSTADRACEHDTDLGRQQFACYMVTDKD